MSPSPDMFPTQFPSCSLTPLLTTSRENRAEQRKTARFCFKNPVLGPRKKLPALLVVLTAWGMQMTAWPPPTHILTNCWTLMTSMVPPLSTPPVRGAELSALL